jgi:alkaline phosphatase
LIQSPQTPTLAALKVLSQDEDGLFLMAEQGDIDWANHANDFHRMVGTTYDLHMAVQAVIDFVNQPGDKMNWSNTLFIVTSDHSNSYMRNQAVLGAGDLPAQQGLGSCGYDS